MNGHVSNATPFVAQLFEFLAPVGCPLASKLDLNAFAMNGFTRKHLVVACFGSWCIVYLGQKERK